MNLPWIQPKKRILFVCLANICRSPLAANLLNHELKINHLSHRISVDSAGIEEWRSGQPLHPKLQQFLGEDHIPVQHHRSRPLVKKDGERFDYIITFDTLTLNAAKMRVGETNSSKVSLFPALSGEDASYTIVDPMETRDLKQCYDDIKAGIPQMIPAIKERLDQ
ncbi:MAG: hypothetical protein MR008_03635 [Aerococcus sp.]|nr:hypothetical protein [Aerococcus sp.]